MEQLKVGRFITKKRKEQNLTQEQLAERLGISNKTISKWETGKCMPDYAVVKNLCEELNVSVSELMDGEETDDKSIRLYDEELVVFRITATNGFGGTVTDYVGYDGYTVHFEYQNFYSGKEILWEDVLAYNDTLKSETD